MEQKIRWGIIGLGNIAHSFIKDLALVNNAEITAVASRNLEKSKTFAGEYHVPLAFGSYSELLECKEVDVVYIATPHTFHAELSIMAMDHGKHVLCEKPMGISTEEVEKMIASAKKNNVFLMEALWSRFNPAIRKVKSLVESGEIGDIAYLHADFAFYALDRDFQGRVLNPKLAGGSLLDIGIYPIFLTYLLLGKPDEVLSTSNFHDNGAEIQTSMIFKYPEAHAVLYSGFTSGSEMKAQISGKKGTIVIPERWHQAQGYSVQRENEREEFTLPTQGKGYFHEINEVHACLAEGKLESALWSHQNTLDLIGLMDTVRSQNGIHFPQKE
ncbi:scyllo-inositol 2-dehydrogenase (NADP(+)) IolU [Arenibacter antarcticus]|uniref:Gfo/Idh/MocA family protein n=1 Tax=Arenibacter antarcticus TaxID=2040469 RepID=A0ABW5VDG9_9FLAO|nr:Gfo/Idh/MocA family oxidoreductase [Arenibacter sp. H213]MCM4168264.1 gfo/Idh/MocA family oxidoreductase [Arenibacter sp. H213]